MTIQPGNRVYQDGGTSEYDPGCGTEGTRKLIQNIVDCVTVLYAATFVEVSTVEENAFHYRWKALLMAVFIDDLKVLRIKRANGDQTRLDPFRDGFKLVANSRLG